MNARKKLQKLIKDLVTSNYYSKLSRHTEVAISDKRRKIVLFSHNSDAQGAAILLENIGKELLNKGYSVIFLVRQTGELTERFANIAPVYYFVNKPHLLYILYYIKKVKGYKYILANTAVSGLYSKLFANQGYEFVTLIHELEQAILDLKLDQKMNDVITYSKYVVFPSNYVCKHFQRFVRDYDDKKNIIRPQGLYLTKNHVYDYDRARKFLEEEYGISRDKKILLNVAGGEYRKGFDYFLRMAKISSAREEYVWVWVGPINQQILKENYPDYQKHSNIVFPGYIYDSEVLAQYYDAASLLLLTSREEPFGSIVLEAFLSKTPVIGFKDSGGFVDTVIPGYTGDLAEKGNTDDFLKKVDALITSDKYEEIANNCKEFINDFAFDKYVDFLIEKLIG